MAANWTISAEWELLDSGAPEERACFAAVGIQAHGVWLTEGRDALANRLRSAPLLSAYHLAEWLAWNWWRLRWEPRSNAADWAFSHRLTTVGRGYIWPNLTIFSDGARTALLAKPTPERPQTPFRYIADFAAVIQASEFEAEVDSFIEQVLERLDSEEVANTNLADIWKGVAEERRTPELMRKRKLEALLGQDPDESNPATVAQLIADAGQLGLAAVEEIAAAHSAGGEVRTAQELREIATDSGFDASPKDAVRLTPGTVLPRVGDVAAWRLGTAAARELREQQGLDGEVISNHQLTELAGTQESALTNLNRKAEISFALDENQDSSRIVLRSKWESGRRFELARLLGDRIVGPKGGRLYPATRAYTYRQKVQRAFAAEFLSPFEAVESLLGGDYSLENQLEAAQHFGVSEFTIRTLLVNHGRIERDDLNAELEVAAA